MQQRFYLTVILAAALSVLSGCGSDTAEVQPPLVRTMTVGDASSTETGYSGTVRGRYETRLAFQVGGQILSRNVDAGAHVRAGDVLMVIDARDVQQQANATGAGVAAARSRYELARTERARYEELYAAQAISAAMLDQYRTNERAAEAAYRQAVAQDATSRNALGYTNLIAAEEGQVVAAGQTVLTLTQEGEREIEIAVPESRLSEIVVEMPAAVSLWATGAMLSGYVREISPVPDAASRTYTARIALTNAPDNLPLGMTARVHLTEKAAAGAVIPLSALYQTGDQAGVYVVEDGVVHLQPVTVTAFYANDAVVEGLAQGAVIVTAGVHQLREGEKVRTK